MKIAIIGYGKMGHIIEETARRRGHEIVCIIDVNDRDKFSSPEFASADAAIEFSVPTAAVGNIRDAIEAGAPVVCGTTGWLDVLPEVRDEVMAAGGRLIYGSNFSVGVNIFWAVNRYMASLMKNFPAYTPSLDETHHIHKLDHPSGTAITTAEEIIAADPNVKEWKETEAPADGVLGVTCHRRGEVPGIHSVRWDSPADSITLTHDAKSREGFALGAVMAAEWIAERPAGVYSVRDMFADITK